MPDIKEDQPVDQHGTSSAPEATQRSESSGLVKTNIVSEEIEEWDVVSSDQRRPQFRSAENYGRRNSQR